MKKKIIYLSGAPRVTTKDSAEATGARAHVLGIINGFKKEGFDVSKYIVGDIYAEKFADRDIQKKMSSSIIKRIAADIARIALAKYHSRKAYSSLLDSDINFVYERFGAFQNMGSVFSKKGTKWILETNNPLFAEIGKDRKSIFFETLVKYHEKRCYENCDYLICISEELRDLIIENYNLDKEKIIVVPNGVDTDKFNPERYTPIINSDVFTIGFIGNLYKWAGVDLLLEAISELNQNVNLVIVGDGIEKMNLEAKTKELELPSNKISFIGRVHWDEIPRYIKSFNVAYSGQKKLSTGKMYHSPLKLYEYMSMGCPVIASAFDDSKRLIEDGQNGFLFTPENKSDLKEKIVEAISKKSTELEQLGKNARKTIVENHSWDKRIEKILKEVN